MMYPDDRKYSEEHEWAMEEGDLLVIGITEHAQTSLGDIVFVELPEAGSDIVSGDSIGVIESVKAASDFYAPISGSVEEINQAVVDDPAMINRDPHADGWLIKVKSSDPSELESLMDASAYGEFVKDL